MYQRLNSAANVDSENNHGGSSRTYVLHRTGRSQEDDQLLREGRERSGYTRKARSERPGRELDCWMKTLPQPWTVAMEATIFTGWIYDHLLPHADPGEGGAPADAASDRSGEEEERSDRCRQDRRLPALRFPAGVPHDACRDSRPAPHAALPAPAGAADGADEEPGLRPADGDRSEYNKQRLHKVGYFRELLSANEEVHPSIRPLLKLSRETIVALPENRVRLGQFSRAGSVAGRQDQDGSERFLEWDRSPH